MASKSEITNSIKSEARRLGFDNVGIARATRLEKEASRLETWLKKGYHGKMHYMENHFEKRLDPRLLVEGAKSIISLSYNYFPKESQSNGFKISKYAYGEDYHHVIKDKMKLLLGFIRDSFGDVNGRTFVDSAPVMERSWAQKSGLGWIGKHALLIQKGKGSFHFLAQLILDIELSPDPEFKTDHCGSCTQCIDACPTDAILPQNTVDASKCISYFTIELKGVIPEEFKGSFDDWMFGCDICQDVCPWNRFSEPHGDPLLRPKVELLQLTKKDWVELSQDLFSDLFRKSAVKRTGYEGLKRNIRFLTS